MAHHATPYREVWALLIAVGDKAKILVQQLQVEEVSCATASTAVGLILTNTREHPTLPLRAIVGVTRNSLANKGRNTEGHIEAANNRVVLDRVSW